MPNIIYEDENILVCSKPKGLLVHGDEHEKRMTLSNMVLSYLYQKGEYNPRLQSGFVPGPAHRIDRNTSGIVIFGKNNVRAFMIQIINLRAPAAANDSPKTRHRNLIKIKRLTFV